MVVGLVLPHVSFAETAKLSTEQVRKIGEAAVALYNAGGNGQRLFEAYSPIDADNCTVKKNGNISCDFDTTEAGDRDQDVYTPNTLSVEINNVSHTMKLSFEFGC